MTSKQIKMDRASVLVLASIVEGAARDAALDSDPKFWAGFDAALQLLRSVGAP